MSDELVQRLRKRADDLRCHPLANSIADTEGDGELMADALDEIERLRAEVASILAERNELSQLYTDAQYAIDAEQGIRVRAESALAALRKRVEEAQILERYESIAFGFGDNKLALVVLGEG